MTNVSCFFSEFIATAVFLVAIFTATDKKNMAPPRGLPPLLLFIVVLGIGAALGMGTGRLNVGHFLDTGFISEF